MKFHLTIFPAHKLAQSHLNLGLIGTLEILKAMHPKFHLCEIKICVFILHVAVHNRDRFRWVCISGSSLDGSVLTSIFRKRNIYM